MGARRRNAPCCTATLRYIDDVELCMAIENLLNRIELGNRFTRAIAVGNPREFSAGDKEEQEIVDTRGSLTPPMKLSNIWILQLE